MLRSTVTMSKEHNCCRKLIPETGLAAAGDACCVVWLLIGLAVGMVVCAGVHQHFILKLGGIDMHGIAAAPLPWEGL